MPALQRSLPPAAPACRATISAAALPLISDVMAGAGLDAPRAFAETGLSVTLAPHQRDPARPVHDLAGKRRTPGRHPGLPVVLRPPDRRACAGDAVSLRPRRDAARRPSVPADGRPAGAAGGHDLRPAGRGRHLHPRLSHPRSAHLAALARCRVHSRLPACGDRKVRRHRADGRTGAGTRAGRMPCGAGPEGWLRTALRPAAQHAGLPGPPARPCHCRRRLSRARPPAGPPAAQPL